MCDLIEKALTSKYVVSVVVGHVRVPLEQGATRHTLLNKLIAVQLGQKIGRYPREQMQPITVLRLKGVKLGLCVRVIERDRF